MTARLAFDREPPAHRASTERPPRRRVAFLVPVVTFVALTVALAYGLTRNPRDIPSALIGKPVPEFSLPPVEGRTLGLSSDDLRGEVSLVNVFASWRSEEHTSELQSLMRISYAVFCLKKKNTQHIK